MPNRIKRVRRRLFLEKVAGGFALAFVFVAVAALFTNFLPEGWGTTLAIALWMSAVAGVVVYVIVHRKLRHKPVEKPE